MLKIIITSLIFSCLFTQANEKKVGVILNNRQDQPAKSDILVEYEFNDKGYLILTLHNIEMNAAARGVTGSIKITGDKILITPAEVYDKRGPVDSIRWYSIRYQLKDIKPGIYTLTHDDSVAEGQDRVVQVKLNLSKPTKNKQNIQFKEPEPSDDPFYNPEPTKNPFGDPEKNQ